MKWDYLLENRKFKNSFYSGVKGLTGLMSKAMLDIESRGLENIPKAPFVLAMHHEIGIDGWIIRTQLKEKIHFWLQYENLFDRGWKKILDNLEEIPIKTEGLMEEVQKSYFQAVSRSHFWLQQKEAVGVFNDGPKKDMMLGEELLPLESRPILGGAVAASYEPIKKQYTPIVPVSFWAPKAYRNQFSRWGKSRTLKNLSILFKEGFSSDGIPYKIAYGLPLNPRDYLNKSQLSEEIRKVQIRLHEEIRGD